MDKRSRSTHATMDKAPASVKKALTTGVRQSVVMMALAVLAACVFTGVSGATTVSANCPISKPDPSMAELFFYSDLVVLGRVVKQYKAAPDAQSFTAELQVYCVFKGKDLPQFMNVSNAGKVENQCFETEFKEGNSYLVYLRKGKGATQFTPAYKHHPDTYKDEIYSMCDVNITYPLGIDKEKADVTCEDDYPEYDYPAGVEYEDYGDSDCIPPFDPTTDTEVPDVADNNANNNNNDDNDNNGGGDDKDTDVHVAQTNNKVNSENVNGPGTQHGNDMDNEDNDDNDGKGVPYSEGNGNNVEVDRSVGDESGSAALRMSFVLLALLHCVVLIFS